MLLLAIFFALIISLLSSMRWTRVKFLLISPACLYGIIWGVIWLFHLLDFMEYLPLSDRAVLYSIIPLLGIFFGEQIGLGWHVRRPFSQKLNLYKISKFIKANNYIILFLAIIMLVSVYKLYGAPWEPGIGKIIKAARVQEGASALKGSGLFGVIQYINLLRGLVYVALIISIPLFYIDRKLSVFCYLSGFTAAALNDLSWGSRTLVYDAGLFLIIWFFLMSKQRQSKTSRFSFLRMFSKYGLLIGILSTGIVTAQIITASTHLEKYGKIGDIVLPYGVVQLIEYNTAPLVTFDQTLDDNPTTYGLMSFGGVVNWLYMLRIYRGDLFVYEIWQKWEAEYPTYSRYGNGTNVYTSLRYFYSDFGVLGLFAIPFFTGFFSSIFAKRANLQSNDGFFNFCWLAYCYYIVFRSPIIFPFRVDYILFSVFIFLFLKIYTKFSLKPQSKHYMFS